ncbi:hypothetical protein FA13DRAFT_1777861 [Coprinellus micaceus]|uniref:F-box domain-containing protein n=1 Tax=Coprinellus micaceus TaxID=71717 RepID=A0A4Y7SRM4_COPMI|nr:hypothetical protein FA13DRAFT_1777861 [Coprinellus micaceus]
MPFNHWVHYRPISAFPNDPFKLKRHSPEHGRACYALSHSMLCASDGLVDVHVARNVDLAVTVTGTTVREGGEQSYESDWDGGASTQLRPRQASTLARDFPRDLLLVIFNYVLWQQLCDAKPEDYVAHQVTSSLEDHTSIRPPVLLSKQHSPLFLSFVCSHWREICLGTPTLWSNLFIHVWNRPFPAHSLRPAARRCNADRAKLSLCNLFLQRSGSTPLTLSINADWDMQVVRATDERMVLGRIFQLCAEHAGRWRELKLRNLDDRFLFQLLFDTGEREGPESCKSLQALERLSMQFKHVEEDGALFPRGDPDSSYRSWLEQRRKAIAAYQAFKVWCEAFVEGLMVKGGEEPLYTGSLRKAWVRIVKDNDGIGFLEADAGVDSLDWNSPLVSLYDQKTLRICFANPSYRWGLGGGRIDAKPPK